MVAWNEKCKKLQGRGVLNKNLSPKPHLQAQKGVGIANKMAIGVEEDRVQAHEGEELDAEPEDIIEENDRITDYFHYIDFSNSHLIKILV